MKTIEVYSLANGEALRTILIHEKIDFSSGAGPHGQVFQVKDEEHPKLVKAIDEWHRATTSLSTIVRAMS